MKIDNKKLFVEYLNWGFIYDGIKFIKKKIVSALPEFISQQIMSLVNGVANRPEFFGHSWIDDMKGEGIILCYKIVSERSFNPNKGKNIFGYLTKSVIREFNKFRNVNSLNSLMKRNLSIAYGYKPSEQGVNQYEVDRAIRYLKKLKVKKFI